MLLGPADVATFQAGGTADRPSAVADVPQARLAAAAGRLDRAMPVGNEGAGVVVGAGADAQSWVGRRVATQTFGMYAQFRVAKIANCLLLSEGTTAKEGAGSRRRSAHATHRGCLSASPPS